MPALLQFAPYEPLPDIEKLNKVLSISNLAFVPQAPKSREFNDAYEPRIFLKQEVQTRANSWHDFFNALVWQSFTHSKRVINKLHYNLQKERFPSKERTPAENMLTLFDENGALVVSCDKLLLDLIRAHRWHELFWQRRKYTQENLKIIVFGHGLYEKALKPFVGITAQCLLLAVKDIRQLCADELVARFLEQRSNNLTPKDLSPLPILGMPTWWEQNNDEEFYANTNYFRPLPARCLS